MYILITERTMIELTLYSHGEIINVLIPDLDKPLHELHQEGKIYRKAVNENSLG